jgi:lipoyl(octanoyl) transferase
MMPAAEGRGGGEAMRWLALGRVPYREAWGMQEALRARRIAGEAADSLLLVEHPPVITLGRRCCEGDVISTPELLARDGIELVRTNRGGRATYHGPGQLVGYFICSLDAFRMGVREFVHSIEEVCIRALADFGIASARDEKNPGLWVGRDKIVAIGLSVERGVSLHGFALNVAPDLAAYRHIVACGLCDRGVTSMASCLAAAPAMDRVALRVVHHAGQVFLRDMVEAGDMNQVNVSSSGGGVGLSFSSS